MLLRLTLSIDSGVLFRGSVILRSLRKKHSHSFVVRKRTSSHTCTLPLALMAQARTPVAGTNTSSYISLLTPIKGLRLLRFLSSMLSWIWAGYFGTSTLQNFLKFHVPVLRGASRNRYWKFVETKSQVKFLIMRSTLKQVLNSDPNWIVIVTAIPLSHTERLKWYHFR